MIAGFLNEFDKIMWRFKYRAIPFLCGILCALYGVLGANTGLGDALSLPAALSNLSLSNFMFVALPPLCSIFLPLVIFMLAADLYTHEIENKSIKCCLMRPVSRLSVYLSKFLAITCYTALLLGVAFVVTGVFQVISDGSANALGGALGAYAVSLLPLLGFIATAAFISVLVPNPSMSMFLSIIVYVAMLAASLIWSQAGSAFFTSYLGWYKMWMGSGVPAGHIITTIALITSYSALVFMCGYFVFDKKDV